MTAPRTDPRPARDWAETRRHVDAWWRAANHLSAAQIYLLENPLQREPLDPAQIKPRLLGHWGTCPALNLTWAHLNRVIVERERRVLFVCGPGHGGPAMVANAWLDGTYSERFPHVPRSLEGLTALVRQFSFPGGIPSHAAPETPGSINEGGELGYSLAHAFGAALDSPDLVVACVIGDGEAETGALATSWHAHTFLDARTDGAVLPILNLNGYKIANPTILARMDDDQLCDLLQGYGWRPIWVEGGFDGEDPDAVHDRMRAALDDAFDTIADIQAAARGREGDAASPPRWPMIVLRTPKGWTGPVEVDGLPVENTWRAHQVPLGDPRRNLEHLAQLGEWLGRYRPEELFTERGEPSALVTPITPEGSRRMSAVAESNGGAVLRPLELPPLDPHAVDPFDDAGVRTITTEGTRPFGAWLAEVMRANPDSFRLFGPDETASNHLDAVYDVTAKAWQSTILDTDEHLARRGRVIEMLSEHVLEGLLEGYLLSGRHGLLASYEAFVHIVDSMVGQHAKWLESAAEVPWREPVASLNLLLTSHVWRQDHNGFSHQDPGFLDVVANKRARLVRIYLPADANTLLAVGEHVLGSRDRVNVVVAGKQEQPAWLSLEEGRDHLTRGLSVWDWAGNEHGDRLDAVLVCAGDVPTLETVAAARLLAERTPELSLRVVNIVDLMRLQDVRRHPHGMSDADYDAVLPPGVPTVFDFHGYPALVHRFTYRRANHDDLHVHGYEERGTTTTPFDMAMMNGIDRYQLAIDVLERVPGTAETQRDLIRELKSTREECRAFAHRTGEDPDWITGFRIDRGTPTAASQP